ncbi:S8 family serine peptidase [Methylocystis sp.]|uniref:S8 family serine peptidase n=1 Tax=Methylocystis sp. TaxID=1911079 RepID=UPI003DA216BB
MRGKLNFALALCAIVLTFRGSSALGGEDSGPKRDAPGVIITFEGGVAGENLTGALEDINDIEGVIKTEPYVVRTGDSICSIMASTNFPPPCASITKFVDRLNPQVRLLARGLKEGETLLLPRLEIETYRAVDNFALQDKRQEKQLLDWRSRSYRNLGAEVVERSLGRKSLVYDAYSVYIPTKDDTTAQMIFDKLAPKVSRNMFVDVLRSAAAPTKLHSLSEHSAEQIKTACVSKGFNGDVYRYDELVDADREAMKVVKGSLPAALAPVRVVLIDTPISPAPNLYQAYEKSSAPGSSAWKCQWADFNRGVHHATHLAGIIASRKELGFAGLAANAKIESFEWVRLGSGGANLEPSSADRVSKLNKRFMNCEDCALNPLRVFLSAVDFDPFDPNRSASALLSHSEKLKCPVGIAITKRRPLLIVAAGQEDNLIAKESNMSPQAYGDSGNVIVVTACEDCSRDGAKIMAGANASLRGAYMVHVAAPGGQPIPGWVSDRDLSAASGTSQASGYVAGVVAAMIGAFPTIYTSPEFIKTRIQATARPFAPQNNNVSPESDKLTSGVVDPFLALLDPTKHWYKDSTGWHEAARWPGGRLFLTSHDSRKELSLKSSAILRVYRAPDIKDGLRHWTIYDDLAESGETVEPGTVRRNELVTLETTASIIACDGTPIALTEVEDFIPALSKAGLASASCQSPR